MSAVEVRARAALPCTAERAFAEVADLERYPRWLRIVQVVLAAPAVDGDAGPAWWVEVGARVGPLRRTKRLRMVQVVHEPPWRVRFERAELDGRPHAPWTLDVSVEPSEAPAGGRVSVAMELCYGGSSWIPPLDAVLASEVRRAAGRLAAQVA